MADRSKESDFRFGMVVRWAPAFILVLTLVLLVSDYLLVGSLLALGHHLLVHRATAQAVGGGGNTVNRSRRT